MFCKKCGTQLNDNDKFCYQCGEKIIISTIQNNESIQNGDRIENVENNNENSNANDLIEEGKAFEKNGQYEEAKDSYLKAIEILSKQVENEKWYVNMYGDNEDYIKIGKADDLYKLGDLYCKTMQYEKAINSFLKCVELYPDATTYLVGLGDAYFKNGDIEKAIDSLLRCAKLYPNSNVGES